MTRISALPQRDWPEHADSIAQAMTEFLRTPNGTRRFRPSQGQALYEVMTCRGGFFALIVGAGKTDVAVCAPTVLDSKRPLMLVPGKVHKRKAGQRTVTEQKIEDLRSHWRVPANYPVESYNRLARDKHATFLLDYQPDLLVCDESQSLKQYTTAAVARRCVRYYEWCVENGKRCDFVFLSGSPSKDSILDFWHLMQMALREGSPLPTELDIVETWAAAVDPEGCDDSADLSVLEADLGPGIVTVSEARRRIKHRIRSTPGVIITKEEFDWPLEISTLPYELPESVTRYYPKLRNDWEAPDGFPLNDAQTEVWAHAMRLAVGLQYMFDPWPPDEWREARKQYGRQVRAVLEGGQLDTEKQVRSAIESGRISCPEYWEWREIEPTHKQNTVKVVIDDIAKRVAESWLQQVGDGIVWVHHTELGRYLSEALGIPFHRQGGYDAKGVNIEQAKGPIIASIQACGEAFNLQYAYAHSLFLEHPRGGQWSEQAIGRTHRPGQTQPVRVWYAWACLEHRNALAKAQVEAAHSFEVLGIPQKLLQSPPRGMRMGTGDAWAPPRRQTD